MKACERDHTADADSGEGVGAELDEATPAPAPPRVDALVLDKSNPSPDVVSPRLPPYVRAYADEARRSDVGGRSSPAIPVSSRRRPSNCARACASCSVNLAFSSSRAATRSRRAVTSDTDDMNYSQSTTMEKLDRRLRKITRAENGKDDESSCNRPSAQERSLFHTSLAEQCFQTWFSCPTPRTACLGAGTFEFWVRIWCWAVVPASCAGVSM